MKGVHEMKLRRWLFFLTAVSLSLVLFVACGDQSPDSSSGDIDGDSSDENFVTIATGSSGGAYYLLGSGIVNVLNKFEPDITANSEATNGTADNIQLLKNGEVNFGIILADVAYKAYAGEGEYEGSEQDNLRIVLKGHSNDLQILTLANSGIETLSDLEGKRVSLAYGLPDVTEDILFSAAGLKRDEDYKSEILPHDDAITALKDGNIDAVTYLTAAPAAAITDISSTHDIHIIPLTAEERSKVISDYSYFEEGIIEGGTYAGLNHDIETLKISAYLLTNEEVSENLVYKVTKSILDNPDEFGAVHQSAELWALPNAAEGFHIPAHPGAIKYYEENGIEIE